MFQLVSWLLSQAAEDSATIGDLDLHPLGEVSPWTSLAPSSLVVPGNVTCSLPAYQITQRPWTRPNYTLSSTIRDLDLPSPTGTSEWQTFSCIPHSFVRDLWSDQVVVYHPPNSPESWGQTKPSRVCLHCSVGFLCTHQERDVGIYETIQHLLPLEPLT